MFQHNKQLHAGEKKGRHLIESSIKGLYQRENFSEKQTNNKYKTEFEANSRKNC